MSDGKAEVKQISFIVQATQAINANVRVGASLDKVGTATGNAAQRLAQYDRLAIKATDTMYKSAVAIARLKSEYNNLSAAQTQANNANARLSARLLTANKKIQEQTSIIQTQKSVITGIIKENLQLSGSYDRVASSASRAGAGIKSATAGQSAKGGAVGGTAVPTTQGLSTGTAGSFRAIASGADTATKAVDKLQNTVQQNALRYQLYDVAATFGIMGRAALGAGFAATKAGIEWDKNFANVIRTSQVTGAAIDYLRTQFLDLQTTVPITAEDIATIGTLGAQMGIASGDLSRFTKITAKFAATAGITVDASATALSRLNVLLPDVRGNYERLASTILKTGVNSVATEDQIVRGTNLIASMGQIAGLTTPDVVALASAMSSLGLRPELQRSVITSSFSRILTATSEVTDKTSKFGAVLHMTGLQFQTAFRKDAIGTYRDLLQAIASRGDAVTVLKDLGLASQRLTPNLLKMGQNVDVLDKALADTTSEWSKNTELTRQYDVIASTVSAKIQVMGQTWNALLVTLDQSDTTIGPLIDVLTGFLGILKDIARTPGVSTMASIGSAVVVLTGVLALGAAGLAAFSAGFIAITNAATGLQLITNGNTATTAINTATNIANAEARGLATAATVAQTEAVALNSTANGVNSATNVGAGGSLLKFTGWVINALPTILKWAGVIGLATAAVTSLATVMATAPDWSLDLEKSFNGVGGTQKTIKFDTSKIKADMKKVADGYKSSMAKIQAESLPAQGLISFGTAGPGSGLAGAMDNWLSNPKTTTDAAKKDLMDVVGALDSEEKKLAAVNAISKELGVTQSDLLSTVFPELGTLLGENAASAAEMQDATLKLEAAQELWASALGSSDEVLSSLRDNVKSSAGAFLDFGDSLKKAYEVDPKSGKRIGGGLDDFTKSMTSQIAGFESFYGDLGKLVQRGGVQLASFFASQGPAAAQALTDSLTLNGDQISKIEDQMSLAAFYASDAFANTFAQNNAILAQVWQQSGHNPEAVAAFNKALADSMKNGSIDPKVLAELGLKYGIKIDAQMIPDINPDDFERAKNLATAKITPMKISVTTSVGQGDFTATRELDSWIVEMNGHTITMNVDPNTESGRTMLQTWRNNEYQVPLTLQTNVNTVTAANAMDLFIKGYISQTYYLNFKPANSGLSLRPGFGVQAGATGALIHNDKMIRKNYPGFSTGTIFRGPGSGTSDSILARVSNGEAITRARAVRHYGTQMMDDINNMRFPRYATGTSYPQNNNGGAPGTVVNATVVQNYPTTIDPIKKLKQDAEAALAGIWV